MFEHDNLQSDKTHNEQLRQIVRKLERLGKIEKPNPEKLEKFQSSEVIEAKQRKKSEEKFEQTNKLHLNIFSNHDGKQESSNETPDDSVKNQPKNDEDAENSLTSNQVDEILEKLKENTAKLFKESAKILTQKNQNAKVVSETVEKMKERDLMKTKEGIVPTRRPRKVIKSDKEMKPTRKEPKKYKPSQVNKVNISIEEHVRNERIRQATQYLIELLNTDSPQTPIGLAQTIIHSENFQQHEEESIDERMSERREGHLEHPEMCPMDSAYERNQDRRSHSSGSESD